MWSGWSFWPTVSWWMSGRIRGGLRQLDGRCAREGLRSGGTGGAQLARVGAAELAHDGWHFGGRSVAGGDALAGHWPAATGHAAAGEVGTVRHDHRDLAARSAEFRPSRREPESAGAGREPGARRDRSRKDGKIAGGDRGLSRHPL